MLRQILAGPKVLHLNQKSVSSLEQGTEVDVAHELGDGVEEGEAGVRQVVYQNHLEVAMEYFNLLQ